MRTWIGSPEERLAGFYGQQNAVVFCYGRRGRGFRSGSVYAFGLHGFVGFIVTDRCSVQRTLVRSVCFRFAESMGVMSACLKSCDLFRSYVVGLGFPFARMNLFVLFRFFGNLVGCFGFFLFFRFFLLFIVENRATD